MGRVDEPEILAYVQSSSCTTTTTTTTKPFSPKQVGVSNQVHAQKKKITLLLVGLLK
jgi:hypothetical protein